MSNTYEVNGTYGTPPTNTTVRVYGGGVMNMYSIKSIIKAVVVLSLPVFLILI